MRKRILGILLLSLLPVAASDLSRLLEEPELLASPGALMLVPGRTSSVYRAEKGEYQFNLHSYMVRFEGRFWAIWSSGLVEEDSNGQMIRYATSKDGHHWSQPGVVAADPDGMSGPGFWIARGIFVDKGRLSAVIARIRERRSGEWPGLRLMRYEWDGRRWQDTGLFIDDCMSNYPPFRLGPHWFMTCRDNLRHMYTALSPDLRNGSWKLTPLPEADGKDSVTEPSQYVDPDGVAHLIFRDLRRSGFMRHSVSRDDGVTWTAPVLTNYPDATSKNFSGRLSNGWYFLINNPDPKRRDPLAISFSRDGWSFGHPLALRSGVPPRRFGPSSKGGSVQYPHALEYGGSLWVIYSTNKEDIEISEYPIASFGLAK